jgi:hypothetical protein
MVSDRNGLSPSWGRHANGLGGVPTITIDFAHSEADRVQRRRRRGLVT